MPGLLRKLIVVAAVDGLVLHAHGVDGARHTNGGNSDSSSIRIDYKTNKVTPLSSSASSTGTDSLEGRDVLEAYGLVGEHGIMNQSLDQC